MLWTWELCVDLAIYFWKSYLLNILYEKRIKVVFVLESEWRVCLWCIKPNMLEHMKGFSCSLAWELPLERHHRLERGLRPNVFTANYVVASRSRIKSILGTKIPCSSRSSHNVALVGLVLAVGLTKTFQTRPEKLLSWTDFTSLQNQFKRIKDERRDYQHLLGITSNILVLLTVGSLIQHTVSIFCSWSQVTPSDTDREWERQSTGLLPSLLLDRLEM